MHGSRRLALVGGSAEVTGQLAIEDTWKPEDRHPRQPSATPQPIRFCGRMDLDQVRAMRDLGGIIDKVSKHQGETGIVDEETKHLG